MKRTHSRLGRALAGIMVSSAVLAGCANAGSSDSSGGASSDQTLGTRGIQGSQVAPSSPAKGGVLSFAGYAPVASLDPTVTHPAGSTGGTELAAVYDVLIKYDNDSHSFEPQLAKSIQASPDYLTWTLELREGVRFSDGTAFDADAVVSSIDRYNERGGAYSALFKEMVQSTVAKDSTTVEFTLSQPWQNFPAILSYGHGMIVAPSALQGEDFTPIGAGAFTVESLQPAQELRLKARSDYWGGEPHLDGLRFVAIAGEQPKLDALRTGGLDMIYLREADTTSTAKGEFPGFLDITNMSILGNINNAPGRPGSDVRVRQAMAYAIDPEVVNQRAWDGAGMAGSDMFGPQSVWHGDATGVKPDSTKAQDLLDQTKAEGFDGKITYLTVNTPDQQKVALAVQAQLNAVGFDTTIEYVSTATDMVVRTIVDRDYDMTWGAYDVSDIDPEIRLFNTLSSTRNNTISLKSPEMDALLSEVLSAPDADAKRAAINQIQEFVNREQPFLTWASAGQVFIAWSENVHGVTPSIEQILLLDKAYIVD
ncbi:ABC transporter substrate-binding protein [Tomitella biformata]|uniref:ABC transporter substrate-binding protein n=1 Tax=Tomitella biformata TaxID=630403 RepID=UPI000463D1DF|nr:ABC transporter substrate-binding protein [Tomitella biformata]